MTIAERLDKAVKAGRLEVYCGSMFAEKSTNLIRQAKRNMLAGRKVVMLKPAIDNRYSEDKVVTHDGQEIEAFKIDTDTSMTRKVFLAVTDSDVVLIDEIQFFEDFRLAAFVNQLVNGQGKQVYAAGLDMDKDGKPFESTMQLMGLAEEVHKVKAVCHDCGEDAWASVETKKQEGRVNIGNDYKPVCRGCAAKYRYEGVIWI